ncbi:MAG: hypothetical protein HWN51_01670 [Desulfobacterales bacterium]|nr:hypothetical protein [Desulfobacterales bacterium]
MLLADTYLDRVDFLKYLPQTDCAACRVSTCREFIEGLKRGEKKPADCPDISESIYYPFHNTLNADNILPKFPCVTVPQPGPIGVVEINGPVHGSPLLISGNNIHTQDVLTSMLATTRSPFFLVFTDTKGDTVDMAVIYKTLTAEQIKKDAQNPRGLNMTSHQKVVIPGLAATICNELEILTGCKVTVGPICAAELPLFFAESWLTPAA